MHAHGMPEDAFEIRIYNPQASVGVPLPKRVLNLLSNFRGVNQRMHDKTFVVDGKVAVTGGRNMAAEYFDYNHQYNFRDRDALVLGAAVKPMQANFEAFWRSELSVPVEQRFDGWGLMQKNVKIDGHRHALVLRAERDAFTLAEGETTLRGRRHWSGAMLELALEDGARPVEALVVRGAGGRLEVWLDSERYVVEEERRGATAGGAGGTSDDDVLTAPMPAKVVRLACAPGDAVERL